MVVCVLFARLFQSTRPHGVRQSARCLRRRCCTCFNPRSRKERDDVRVNTKFIREWFQSTRHRGRGDHRQLWRRRGDVSIRPANLPLTVLGPHALNHIGKTLRFQSKHRGSSALSLRYRFDSCAAVRETGQEIFRQASCFNPRARAGRDAFIVTDYK